MRVMMLDWQQAVVLAGVLAALGVACTVTSVSRLRVLAPFAIEGAIVAGLYGLWQLAGQLSVLGTSGALARARWIVRAEHDLHLPSEADLQPPLIEHATLAHVVNLYYATMHFTVMGVFLVWLFLRHRDRYRPVRRVLALATLICLLIQLLPVAPPRLLPGFTDIAVRYGQSVYGAYGFNADQLSAMPSVHVCWAVLVGWCVWRIGNGPWRVIGPLHTVVTVFVVVATANHFWADGIVAVAVLGVSALVCEGVTAALASHRTDRGPVEPEPSSLSSGAPSGILRR